MWKYPDLITIVDENKKRIKEFLVKPGLPNTVEPLLYDHHQNHIGVVV